MHVSKIKEVYKKYQEIYNDIEYPKLDENNYIFVHDVDYFLKFNSKELYDNVYKLYINTEALIYDDSYVEAILFHEFTHLYDSIRFRNYSDYINIMWSYSEINASYIQMKKLTNYKPNINILDKIMICNTPVTISEYFKTKRTGIQNESKNYPDTIEELLENLLSLTYFIGEFCFVKEIDKSIYLNIESPYFHEINSMIENYPLSPDKISDLFITIIEKFKENRRLKLAKEFSKAVGGQIPVERFLELSGSFSDDLNSCIKENNSN